MRWLSLCLMALGAGTACSQTYPVKPVRMVAAEAGGGGDFAARLIAHELSAAFGQQVTVDNRGAAAGIIAGQTVAKAPPDGYTLLFYSGLIWTLPLLKEVPYDPAKELSPVTHALSTANILVVSPAVAAKSVQELIALAKAKPGTLNYASSGSGGTPHLAAELFKTMAGVSLVHVPYKGQAAALNDLLSGLVQIMFPNAAAVAPHVKSGRLRALAITTLKPSPHYPGLPTVAASGLPGYESVVVFGMWVPAKTPVALLTRLNRETVAAVNKPDVKEKFFNVGVDTVGTTPEEFAAMIKADTLRMEKLIKSAGIRAD